MPAFYDLSPRLDDEACHYPGDPVFSRDVVASREKGSPYELSSLRMSAHAGAHLDAPAHFLPEGRRLDDYPVARFVLPVLVLDLAGAATLGAPLLDDVRLPPEGGLLLRTRNSVRGLPRAGGAPADYVAPDPAFAERCVALGARIVGIDAPSIDSPESMYFPVHEILLGNDVLVLEGIDLGPVPAGLYTLSALPLHVARAEGSPVRAVLWSQP